MSVRGPLPRDLASLGWNAWFESHARLEPDRLPARVVAEQRGRLLLASTSGELTARLAGRLRHGARGRLDLPAVGDWTCVRPAAGGTSVVDHVLPRSSCLVREASGRTSEPQVLAANVDTVLVVTDCGADFNPRRLERWIAIVEGSGALPLVVLNKSDLATAAEVERLLELAARAAPSGRILAASAATGEGVDELRRCVGPGQTVVLAGSSGVGKSTTLNALLGRQAQETGAVRERDGRGRHVTTARETFALPGGGLVIDTPGLREVAAWGVSEDHAGFDDVEALAARCRFRDCSHDGEPGCVVVAAVRAGDLDPERLAAHRKLQRELAFQARRQDHRLELEERRRWKAIGKSLRARPPKGAR